MVEPAIGEGSAVEALRRRLPVELTVQPVVVVGA